MSQIAGSSFLYSATAIQTPLTNNSVSTQCGTLRTARFQISGELASIPSRRHSGCETRRLSEYW